MSTNTTFYLVALTEDPEERRMLISDRSYQLSMIAALWSHDCKYVYSGAVGELTGSYVSAGEMDVDLIKLKLTAAPKRHYRFLTLTDP